MRSFQFKRAQCKYRTRYEIGNWAAYEGGLRQRGSVTIWLSEDVRKAWCYRRRRKPGGRQVYSNVAIETFWTIGMLYALALTVTRRSWGGT